MSLLHNFTFYLIAAISFSTAHATPTISIVNGEEIGDTEAISKSLVKIGSSGTCTGTLLTKNIVLTASHCPERGIGKVGDVVTHLPDLAKPCNTAKVAEVSYPANQVLVKASQTHAPDFALLRLDGDLCDGIPAELTKARPAIGENFYAAGFGRGTKGKDRADRILLNVTDSREDNIAYLYRKVPSRAKEIYLRLARELQPHYFFSLPVKAESTVCFGDSGGPTYLERDGKAYIAGVNGVFFSHPYQGVTACEDAFLNLFTSVYDHSSEITEMMGNWKKQPY